MLTGIDPVKVYPNPVNDIIIIQSMTEEPVECSIYTLNEREVMQNALSPLEVKQINISLLPTGIYMMLVKGEQVQYRMKIIKQ